MTPRLKPARTFKVNDLIVEQDKDGKPTGDVSRVTEHADFSLPLSLVGITTIGQVTGEYKTRDFRRDAHYYVDEGFELVIEGAGKIRVELAAIEPEEARPQYRYVITNSDGLVLEDSTDLEGAAREAPNARKAAEQLLGFLGAAAEGYEAEQSGFQPESNDMFSEETVRWAHDHDSELTLIYLEFNPGGMEI